MEQCPKEPTTKELLDRIVRLEKRLTLFGDHLHGLSESFMDDHKAQADRFDTAFERIKNLEVSVFPNLLADIESVHQIIGGNGVPAEENPLDSRKSFPPKDDAGKPS